MRPQSDVPQAKASKCPKITVLSRIVTLISLVISLGIMRSNRPIWVGGSAVYFIDYKKIGSYQYMLVSIIVGLAYNLLQTPFAAYYAIRGKRIINNTKFLLFEFYGDKVILSILATAVGAAFGVTTDLKTLSDGNKGISNDVRSKYDEFYSMAFVSAGFLFIGFISSGISSITSSFAVTKEE
ncbi:CASP-like protein 4D1 [Camellia sinensis]|uniref:CASP-like protein 4D1 n=1 Tax=Camellia sinensis TaxID=4442 RepID=UPI001035EA1B|nr:CASP-like protein 4D1 [Camellia sinensis]